MVTSLNQSTPARELGYQAVQYICGRLTMSGTANLPVVKIGSLPAGAVIVGVNTRVITAFSGGTPAFGVGTTAALVGSTGNIAASIAVTAGSLQTMPSVTVAQPLAADTDIYAGCSGGVTAGDAVVAVGFIKPLA